MSQRLWPRDPRDAGQGSFSTAVHHLPVTLFLIFVCVVVSVLTQFGEHGEKADALYMSSQKRLIEARALYQEFQLLSESMIKTDGSPGEEVRPPPQQMEKMLDLSQRLERLEAEAPDSLADVKKGEVWRLFTPMFLHFGITHILFNMMWLWQLGTVLEMRFRSMRFLGLVLFVAAVSNLSEALWSGHTNFGGMSGVVYGLFGFIWIRGKLHPAAEFEMNSRTVTMMLIWLVICFTGAVGRIANGAHVAGLVSGCAAGAVNALMAGGWKIMKRRSEFRSAISSAPDSLHHCVVCGRTEKKNPELEFFVGTDHQEYCRDHLPEDRS